MAKNASGAAFISSKKRAEERLRAKESGIELDDCQENFLEMQHHHLLSCLEKTTVRSVFFCMYYFLCLMHDRVQNITSAFRKKNPMYRVLILLAFS